MAVVRRVVVAYLFQIGHAIRLPRSAVRPRRIRQAQVVSTCHVLHERTYEVRGMRQCYHRIYVRILVPVPFLVVTTIQACVETTRPVPHALDR